MPSKPLLVAAITLLMCAGGSLSQTCGGIWTNYRNLASIFSGVYANVVPISGMPPLSLISNYTPVLIPDLFGPLNLHLRSSTPEGLTLREEVWSFAQPVGGNVTGGGYNFVPLEGRVYHVISNGKQPNELTASDLKVEPEECKMFFLQIVPEVFMGTRPECTQFQEGDDVDKFRPLGTLIYSCGGLTVSSSDAKPLKDETTRHFQLFALTETHNEHDTDEIIIFILATTTVAPSAETSATATPSAETPAIELPSPDTSATAAPSNETSATTAPSTETSACSTTIDGNVVSQTTS